MKTLSLAIMSILALSWSQAQGADRTWDFGGGLGPNFSQLDAVGDDLQSGLGASIWADRYFNQHWFGEVSYGWFNFGSGGSTHLDAYMLGVGYRFDDWGKFSPYAVAGAGFGNAKDFPRSTPQQTGFMWHFRPGFDYQLDERWSIGAAFDWSMIKLDGNIAKAAYMGLPLVTVGWRWGDSQPEPAIVQVTAPARPTEPVVVDIDTDGDGVLDKRDKCPGTPPGSKVNGFGCIKGEKVQLKIMVNFPTGSDVVPESDDAELAQIADLLQRNPKATVAIEGHTDSVGKLKMNMDLSKRRAASVARYISEKFGIEKKRITSHGYGPTKPIASNKTEEGRAQNRRVLGTFKPND